MQRSVFLRLIRCQWTWKVVPWITLLFAILATVQQKVLVLFAYTCVGTCIGMRGCFRSNRFLSSLPFDGRSIFLTRFTTAMALLWCPAIAATVTSFVLYGWTGAAAGFELLTFAGFYTAMFLLAYAILIERFNSDGIPGAFLVFGFAGLLLELLPVAPTAIVEMTVIAMLMFRVWKTIPQSFQLASRPTPACFLQSDCRVLPALGPRLPLMRMIWGWINIWVLPGLFILAGSGHNALGATAIFMSGVWAIFSVRDKWLRTLPISARRRLLIFMLPILGAIAAGDCANLWWSSTATIQMQIVRFAVTAGLMLFQCIFYASVDRYRFNKFGFAVSVGMMGLWGAWIAKGWSFLPTDAGIAAGVRISSHVSDFLLLFLAIAILALLYAVLEWVFAGYPPSGRALKSE